MSQISSNNIKPKLRPVNLDDIPALQKLWQHFPVDYIYDRVRRNEQHRQKQKGLALVATNRHAQVIGYGQLQHIVYTAEISDLIVLPAYRSRGIGTAIIRELVQQTPIRYVEIGVALANPRALALYQQLGFMPQTERRMDLGNGYEDVLYLRLDKEAAELPPLLHVD